MEEVDILKDIEGLYDYIIVANSENLIAKNFNLWTDTFVSHARVATVLGNFEKSSVKVWLNNDLYKNGFSYLIPNNEKEATLCLIVNGISGKELDYYWSQFIKTENIKYIILETKDMEHSCGFLSTYRRNNIFFTGNSAGLTDDFIGCGGFNAVESGILSARSIIYNLDYDNLIQPLTSNIKKLHQVRKIFNTFDNNDLDRIVRIIGTPGIKQLIYNNSLFKVKYAAIFSRLYEKKLV